MAKKDKQTAYRSAGLPVRDMPESERPREKMLAQGVRSLSNTELLAVLIASNNRHERELAKLMKERQA